MSSRTYYEDEIINFLHSLNITNIETNNHIILDGQEIDIYLPDYKIGIEFNGNYWHCDLQSNFQDNSGRSYYHQKKSLAALKKNVFLYHIFEYEWCDGTQKIQILNQLRNLLHKNEVKYFARKCELREITKKEKKAFLNQNHFQGNDNSQIQLRLFSNDELISIMTFCKARFTDATWELSRFCTKSNCNVIGAASKLFNYFVKKYLNQYDTVVSYSDIARTRGTLYETLNFELVNISQPSYVWWNASKKDVLTRYQARMKHETVQMHMLNYHRICDCGTKVWIYKK